MNHKPVLSWEAHLVRKAVEGDRVAFELLIDLHRSALVHGAMRVLRNTDDAYDAVQESVVKAYRAIADFEAHRPFRPWLLRICQNCCMDILRSKRYTTQTDQLDLTLADHRPGIADTTAQSVENAAVRDAIDRLPEKYREVMVMRHLELMEVNEIAAAVRAPEGTVKSWLFRARALLRKDLEPLIQTT